MAILSEEAAVRVIILLRNADTAAAMRRILAINLVNILSVVGGVGLQIFS
jgi:hypothetical protein